MYALLSTRGYESGVTRLMQRSISIMIAVGSLISSFPSLVIGGMIAFRSGLKIIRGCAESDFHAA